MVDQKNNTLLQICDVRLLEGEVRPPEHLAGFVGNQLVSNIVFIFEIQIKGSLRHAGIIHNIGD